MIILQEYIGNPYLKIFLLGLIAVGLNIVAFIEKVKDKIKKYENSQHTQLSQLYPITTTLNINNLISINKTLNLLHEDVSSVKANISTNILCGIFFLVSCLIGFGLTLANINEGVAIFALFIFGFMFVISLISLIWWFVKN